MNSESSQKSSRKIVDLEEHKMYKNVAKYVRDKQAKGEIVYEGLVDYVKGLEEKGLISVE